MRGLSPYTRYWYRFIARGGRSPVGRTSTAPDEPGAIHALRFALVSCSNYTGGYFAAYQAIAQRTDLDLVLHVGDYIYEYGNGADRYGPDSLSAKRRRAADGDDRPARLSPSARPAQGGPGSPGRAPAAAVDHHLRRPRGREQHLGLRGREPHPRGRGRLPPPSPRGVRGLPGVDAVPATGAAGRSPSGHPVLQALHVRQRGRPVGPRDPTEPQPSGRRPPFTTTGGGFIPTGVPSVDASSRTPAGTCPSPTSSPGSRTGGRAARRWHLVGNQVVITPVRFPGPTLGIPSVPMLLNSDQWDGYQADQTDLLDAPGWPAGGIRRHGRPHR